MRHGNWVGRKEWRQSRRRREWVENAVAPLPVQLVVGKVGGCSGGSCGTNYLSSTEEREGGDGQGLWTGGKEGLGSERGDEGEAVDGRRP